MFKKPNPKQNFYELEQQILDWWKENKILDKSISRRPEDHKYTFYDGPITANGEPHTGHMLTFSLKDLFPRYKTMKGFRVSRSLGWDCHGLPVEYQVEKALGFKEKSDIEKYGIEKFNKACKESVEKYRSNIIELEEKIGRLTNSEEEYATMDRDFIESVWWSLKELYEKDLLYEGFKVVPYSTRAGTTLSNTEVALGGYKMIADPAITVEFELKNEPNTYLLAWTTTPWTIPGNLGLAVGKKVKYVKVKGEVPGNTYIVAKDLVEQVFNKGEFEILGDVSVDDLIGKEYIPPFDYYLGRENAHKIYEGDHVTTESGTGIVHLAPYGAEDNDIFQKVGIESFDYLDDQGHFTSDIPDYSGDFYKTANKKIIADLEKKDLLFAHEEYEHEMPMCWRTDTPLIYKPITSWYVAVSKLRDALVENNEKINWIPDHVKKGRFGNWLAEIKDWGISRNRYWGTPLPIWRSESGNVKFIGSFKELEELSGVNIEDPHRPYVDDITFEQDGEKYSRITDVIDVWYDSGAMPFARLHYPFENKDKFEEKFPAEFIAEGIDQTRGWFYSLHAVATTLFDSNAYNNVIINGTITDEKGQKLSKSKGNYTPPIDVIESVGADTVRLNFFSSPLMYGEDTAVTDKTLKSTKQETILPLWNIYTYLTTYANMHDWQPNTELAYNERNVTDDTHPWDHIPFDDIENNLDAWILLKLQNTISEVTENMEVYQVPRAIKAIKDLISETSKWYIRSNRTRFADGDTRALEVLYYVLIETCKLAAPFIPFTTEHIYRQLVPEHLEGQLESVHLTDYPEIDNAFVKQYSQIENEMNILRKIIEQGHNLRVENGLKVRQPLSTLFVHTTNKDVGALTDWMIELISSELNVREVREVIEIPEDKTIVQASEPTLGLAIGLNTEISDELKKEGSLRELTRQIQSIRKNQKLNMGDSITLEYSTDQDMIEKLFNDMKDELMRSVKAKTITKLDSISDGMVIKLDDGEVTISVKPV
jgi:isoleucyl-tRNA synthetase